jgi:hypothetical protein
LREHEMIGLELILIIAGVLLMGFFFAVWRS